MPVEIVLEGSNGSWAKKQYLPCLIAWLVNHQNDSLTAVDVVPFPDSFPPETQSGFDKLLVSGQFRYINKTVNSNGYSDLTGKDVVFVVTPPSTHAGIIESWLPRLSQQGRIFAEKPIVDTWGDTLKLREIIRQYNQPEKIFGFDHYLARVHPFLVKKTKYLKKIGKITSIPFDVLESTPIETGREKTLEQGVIPDLFSHVLAITRAIISEAKSSPILPSFAVHQNQIWRAQYRGAPIQEETLAGIDFELDTIPVHSVVGVCVGDEPVKRVEIRGEKGSINLDLAADRYRVFSNSGEESDSGLLDSQHVKTFIEAVISRKNTASIPGVLSADEAIRITEIFSDVKDLLRHKPMIEYTCNSPLVEIQLSPNIHNG